MQRLEVSGAVRSIYGSLGVKRLTLEDRTHILSRNVGKNYQYSLRNNPEEYSCHLLRGGSLKSSIVNFYV